VSRRSYRARHASRALAPDAGRPAAEGRQPPTPVGPPKAPTASVGAHTLEPQAGSPTAGRTDGATAGTVASPGTAVVAGSPGTAVVSASPPPSGPTRPVHPSDPAQASGRSGPSPTSARPEGTISRAGTDQEPQVAVVLPSQEAALAPATSAAGRSSSAPVGVTPASPAASSPAPDPVLPGVGPPNPGRHEAVRSEQVERVGCTAAQLRRFVKSRAYVPLHELRRRFELNGPDDDVSRIEVDGRALFVGLPNREAGLLRELLTAGDVGYELLMDPTSPLIIGVFPMRPVPRP
jgi:hypothetical protein